MILKVPAKEKVWVVYHNAGDQVIAVMTSKSTRDMYYLYEVSDDGTLTKLGQSSSPIELELKFNIREKMQEGSTK